MKIITISKVGYNHPRNANWSYGIWKVDTIDTKNSYAMSYTVKEQFGGDTRFIYALEELTGYKAIETKGVFGTPNITGVSKMTNIEDKEFINTIATFIKPKLKTK